MDGHAGSRPGVAAPLAAIAVPTLVVDSTTSPAWLRAAARRTAEAVPGARHLGLTGGFHEVPPADLAAELHRFFGA